MEHTDNCECAESLARALGGSAKRDGPRRARMEERL